MSKPGPHSQRALIYAPGGRDGELARQILEAAGMPAEIHWDLAAVCDESEKGAGLAIIAEEAIVNADLRPLSDYLKGQPAWSDFPIIILTVRGGGPERNPDAARLADLLGNVIFLERPFHSTTFVSVVRTAQRGRRRQYEARARLEELTESEQQLQTALTAGHLGSWSLEVPTLTLKASDRCRAHFGRADESFSYADLIASVHPDDRRHMQEALARTLRTAQDYIIEYRNIWPDASVHWIDVRARAIRDREGTVIQLVGVSTDITARKTFELMQEDLVQELATEREALSDLTATLEQRVQQRTMELIAEVQAREKVQEQLLQSQKMESIGKLTGGVAHDFNNLLMAVMGNLELLKKRLPDDPRTHRLIDGAVQGAQRGAALTQRMLAFARQQDLKTSPIDLQSLVLGMKELLERTLGPQVALQFDIAKNLPAAQLDANQTELALLNLAINSRDAMPDGGTIVLSIGQSNVEGHPQLRPGRYLWVKVADTGTGMDAQTLKMAVEPFFSTKPLGKGTGLGLSMVHGLAVQLGGMLELASVPRKGTAATLWLPISTESAVASTIAPAPMLSARPATILLVDDDVLIAMSTVDMLEDLGHKVVEAHSGKRALEILDNEPGIDLLMTDHAMPGMTGTELAALARRKRPALPVLLATGYADLPDGQKSDLPRLAKPYQQSQLKAEINRLLTSH